MPFRRVLLIAAFVLAFVPLGSAQQPGQTSAERAARVRDAFASPYGQALIADFGGSLRKDADAACLKAKGLQADQLEAHGGDLLVKWGTRSSDATAALIDEKRYGDLFTATTELKRLEQNADVKRYVSITEPARQAKLLDHILEDFERYVLIRRINLTPVHPAGAANTKLANKNPTEAAEKALEKFLAGKTSAALDRYLDLSDQSDAALAAAMKKDDIIALGGPYNFFKGVETDLAEICIGRRS